MSLSHFTFLDLVFALIIAVSTGFALTKGLAREVISLIALVGGFLLAAFCYPVTAAWFVDWTRTETIANLLGFLTLFLGTLLAGAAASFAVNRFVKMASLEWIDRLLGGLYGFIRGWAVASVIVLALVAFPVHSTSKLSRSWLAPYLLAGARAAAVAVPEGLKERFRTQYRKVLDEWNSQGSSL